MLIPLDVLARTHHLDIGGVLHLGCHLAEEAKAYHQSNVGKVWWVEALPDVAERARQRLARYPDQEVIEACVADRGGETVTFHRANNGMSSSLLDFGTHTEQSPDVHYTEDLTLTTTTVDEITFEYHVEADFLNMDLQGAELLALRGAVAFLRGVDFIYTEVNWEPLYVGCVLLPQLDAWLADQGFTRYDTQMAGNSGWGDAFYARPKALGL